MREQRWFGPLMLAAGLFAINVVARLVIRFGFNDDDLAENRAGIVMFAVLGLVFIGWTFVMAQRKRPSQWLPELAAAAVGGLLLTILVGPFVSGGHPFNSGAGNFFSQVWLYGGFAIAGTLIGYWVAVMLGRDHRSRSLKAYEKARSARPVSRTHTRR